MWCTLNELMSVINLKRRSSESFVFFLHYRVTFAALLFCCALVSTQHFITEKIKCMAVLNEDINIHLLNSYCWATSTYSVSKAYLEEVGVNVPHPGVGASENKQDYEYRNFYQYVPIVLFLQAILFYIPHTIWKSIQPDFMSTIPDKINKMIDPSEDRGWTFKLVARFIVERLDGCDTLAIKYLMCEILTIANVLIQTFLLDKFFHGKFLNLGLFLEVYYSSEILSDPIRLFPLVTICTFSNYGPSGNIDVLDALCVLPINALNGKIFLVLWVWLTVLFFLSLCNIVYLVACMMVPACRVVPARVCSWLFRGRDKSDSYVKLLLTSGIGGWFVLSSLKMNTEKASFYHLTDRILSEINIRRQGHKDRVQVEDEIKMVHVNSLDRDSVISSGIDEALVQ